MAQKGLTALRNRVVTELGPRARDLLVHACQLTKLSQPARFARQKLTIVTFHRVLPAEHLTSYPMPGIAVTPPQLEQFLGYFTETFDCLPLQAAFEQYRSRTPEEKPVLAVTFDDGAYDNFRWAFPILEKFGLRASFYIPVGNLIDGRPPWPDRAAFALSSLLSKEEGRERLERLLKENRLQGVESTPKKPGAWTVPSFIQGLKRTPPDAVQRTVEALEDAAMPETVPSWAGMMTEAQLLQLSEAGHEVGSHSLTHPIMPLCDDARLVDETRQSRRLLGEIVNRPIRSFCYPDGAWDARCVAAVQEAGYSVAVTTNWGLNSRTASPFQLRRCDMNYAHCTDRLGQFSSARLAFRMSGLRRMPT